MLNIVLLGLVV